MQFISTKKNRKRIETRFTHISSLLYFGMFMPNMHAVFWCSCCYYMLLDLASYTQNAMVSTWRDKDKGIVLALLLSYLRCFLFFVLFVFVTYLWGILVVQIIIHYMFSEVVTIRYVVFWSSTSYKVNSWSEFLHPQVEYKSEDTSKSDPVK